MCSCCRSACQSKLEDSGSEPASDCAEEEEEEEEEEEPPSEAEREWRELVKRDGDRFRAAAVQTKKPVRESVLEHDGFVYFGAEVLGRIHEMPSSATAREIRVMVMCHRHISCSMDMVLSDGMNKTAIHKWLLAAHRFPNADQHRKACSRIIFCFVISMVILYANT